MDDRPDVTRLLHDLSHGRRESLDRLMPIVYDEMRRIARGQLRHEQAGHTLNATALAHEAYLKLLDVERVEWLDRAHFFATAARVMRRILIDYARGKRRQKRGGGAAPLPLTEAMNVPLDVPEDLLELDEALSRLEAVGERLCRVVECRCFGGLSVEDTAQVLGVSPATVKRDWAFARAWLNRELGATSGGADPPP